MTGNILGEPFDKFVVNQIKKRQQTHGSGFNDILRSPEQIQVLNNRNAWIKMASGVEVKDETRLEDIVGIDVNKFKLKGLGLAKNFILFNGTSKISEDLQNIIFREGIPTSKTSLNDETQNNAYGLGGSQFGIQPMPGVVDVKIDNLNRGSIRKAIVTLKAYNKKQFEIIELLYLRIGFTMLLEWGWDKYISNEDGTLKNVENTLLEDFWFEESPIDLNETARLSQETFGVREGINDIGDNSQLEVLKKIKQYRERYDGNYDGFLGRVTNFSWKFDKEGTYNITINLVTLGDIIESLQVKIPAELNINDINDIDEDQDREGEESVKNEVNDRISKFLTLNIKNYTKSDGEFVHIFEDWSPDTSLFISKEKLDIKELGKSYEYYIRFKSFLDYLNNQILPWSETSTNDSTVSCLEIDTENMYSKYHPGQISLNPSVCFINSFDGFLGSFFTKNDKNSYIFTERTKKSYNEKVLSKFNEYLIDQDDNTGIGDIGEIYLNVGHIIKVLNNNLDSEGNLSLYKFLETLTNDVNSALGGVNKFEPIIKDDTIITIIDSSFSPSDDFELLKKEEVIDEAEIEVLGYNPFNNESNFVRDISFNTKITPQMASQIAIGATAGESNTINVDGTAFSKWSRGLRDRFNIKIEYPKEIEKEESGPKSILEKIVPYTNKKFGELRKLTLKEREEVFKQAAKNSDLYFFPRARIRTGYLKINREFNNQKRQLEKELPDNNYISYLINLLSGDGKGTEITFPNSDFKFKAGRLEPIIQYPNYSQTTIDKGKNLYKQFLTRYNNEVFKSSQQPSSTIGFIPIELNLTMDGISGIKIYQQLKLRQDFLPLQYPKAFKFLITKSNQQISGNKWETKLTTTSTSNIDESKIKPPKVDSQPIPPSQSTNVITPFAPLDDIDFKFVDNRRYFNPQHVSPYGEIDNRTRLPLIDIDKFIRTEINIDAQENFRKFFDILQDMYGGYTMELLVLDRTFEKSAELLDPNKGGSKDNAPPGRSPHNYNAAIDVNVLTPQGQRLKKEGMIDVWKSHNFDKIAALSGLTWGGNFKKYEDAVHFAYEFNRDIALSNLKTQYNLTNNDLLNPDKLKNIDSTKIKLNQRIS